MPWVTRMRVWMGKIEKNTHVSVVSDETKCCSTTELLSKSNTTTLLRQGVNYHLRVKCQLKETALGKIYMKLLCFLLQHNNIKGSKTMQSSLPSVPHAEFLCTLSLLNAETF